MMKTTLVILSAFVVLAHCGEFQNGKFNNRQLQGIAY